MRRIRTSILVVFTCALLAPAGPRDLVMGAEAAPPTHQASSPARGGEFEVSKTELALAGAAFLVALVTFVFAAAMTVVGLFNYGYYKEAKAKSNEAEERFKEIYQQAEKARLDVEQAVVALEHNFGEKVRRQGEESIRHRRYFEALWRQYSQLLVGIIEKVGESLQPQQVISLKSMVAEAEACMDLFNPLDEEVERALWRLEKLGSAGSVTSLKALADDPMADADIRVRAQAALMIVLQRVRDVSVSSGEGSH